MPTSEIKLIDKNYYWVQSIRSEDKTIEIAQYSSEYKCFYFCGDLFEYKARKFKIIASIVGVE
jgi:hypothetical protein